jgi:acetyl-CoA carboxylase / biotin carboxylase 1
LHDFLELTLFFSRAGRMEAKGCAKSAVWKDARRKFYWAVRARVALSSASAKIAVATPDSTHDYRIRLLYSLASIDPTTDHRGIAEALEKLDLSRTLASLKADHLLRRLLDIANEDRKATMDGLIRLVDELSEDEKTNLGAALQNSLPRNGK